MEPQVPNLPQAPAPPLTVPPPIAENLPSNPSNPDNNVSRRNFLTGLGAVLATAAIGPRDTRPLPPPQSPLQPSTAEIPPSPFAPPPPETTPPSPSQSITETSTPTTDATSESAPVVTNKTVEKPPLFSAQSETDRKNVEVQRKVAKELLKHGLTPEFIGLLVATDLTGKANLSLDDARFSISWPYNTEPGKVFGSDGRFKLDISRAKQSELFNKIVNPDSLYKDGPSNNNVRVNFNYDSSGRIASYTIRINELPLDKMAHQQGSWEEASMHYDFEDSIEPNMVMDAMTGEMITIVDSDISYQNRIAGKDENGNFHGYAISVIKQAGLREDGSFIVRSINSLGEMELRVIPPPTAT